MTAEQYYIARNKLLAPKTLTFEETQKWFDLEIKKLKSKLSSVEELKKVLEQEKNMQDKMSSSFKSLP